MPGGQQNAPGYYVPATGMMQQASQPQNFASSTPRPIYVSNFQVHPITSYVHTAHRHSLQHHCTFFGNMLSRNVTQKSMLFLKVCCCMKPVSIETYLASTHEPWSSCATTLQLYSRHVTGSLTSGCCDLQGGESYQMQQQPGLILSQDPAVRVQQLQQHPDIISSSYSMMQVSSSSDWKINLPASKISCKIQPILHWKHLALAVCCG